jgi:hypothetical protein
MDTKSDKPLRLFVNPFAIWTDLALKTAEAMWSSAHVAVVRANNLKVGVIPTADAPAPKLQAAANSAEAEPAKAKPAEAMLASAHAAALRSARNGRAKTARAPVKQASKAVRFKAARAKLRSKANAKRRAKR